jgi:CBS domain-containing protein
MAMHVEDLMTRDVHTCSADESLEEAARAMWERDVGCLVVIDDERRPIAMITDRDIAMAGYLRGCCLRDMRVHQAMSQRLISCEPRHTVADVEQLMQRQQIRRVPVVDPVGKLLGIIAFGDLARAAVSNPLRIAAAPGLARTAAAIGERRWVERLLRAAE